MALYYFGPPWRDWDRFMPCITPQDFLKRKLQQYFNRKLFSIDYWLLIRRGPKFVERNLNVLYLICMTNVVSNEILEKCSHSSSLECQSPHREMVGIKLTVRIISKNLLARKALNDDKIQFRTIMFISIRLNWIFICWPSHNHYQVLIFYCKFNRWERLWFIDNPKGNTNKIL